MNDGENVLRAAVATGVGPSLYARPAMAPSSARCALEAGHLASCPHCKACKSRLCAQQPWPSSPRHSCPISCVAPLESAHRSQGG
eukprot:360701-Chlamydomonas_euryale.AAC.4